MIAKRFTHLLQIAEWIMKNPGKGFVLATSKGDYVYHAKMRKRKKNDPIIIIDDPWRPPS